MENKTTPAKTFGFGPKGTGIVVIGFFCYLIGQCLGNAGMSNTVVPAFVEIRGFDSTAMTSWLTIAAWIGIPFIIIWSRVAERVGMKRIIMIGLGFITVGSIIMGCSGSTVIWCVAFMINVIGYNAIFLLGGPGLVAKWFPTKKGLALGWASMGLVSADIIWTPYVGKAMYNFGPLTVFLFVAAIAVIFLIIVAIFVKEKPEDAGAYPDNIPVPLEDAALMERINTEYRSSWTFKKLLSTKETWLVAIAGGLLWLGGSGPIVTFYARMLSFGYEELFVSSVFQTVAVFSLCGSLLYGVIDTKLGTKKSFISCGVVILLGLIFMFFLAPHSKGATYIGALFLGASIGGVPNLLASMQTSIWGRWDFAASSKIITPIAMIILNCEFMIATVSLNLLGNYNLFFGVLFASVVLGIIILFVIRPRMLGSTDEQVMSQFRQET